MNLRELLLQFAGESNISLNVEDIVMSTTDNAYLIESINNGIKVKFIDEHKTEETKAAITKKLEKAGYKVDIYENGNGINIIVE